MNDHFFIPAAAPVRSGDWQATPEAKIILFHNNDLLLRDGTALPHPEHLPEEQRSDAALHVGELDGCPCYAIEIRKELTPPPCLTPLPFRTAACVLPEDTFTAVCRGKELLHWRRQHQFCGGCGAKLKEPETDAALVCPVCGEHYYPQLAPAVIVAITRGHEILLAHNRRFQSKIHGLIAGFVEAGESAEQAIRREIREETGIAVGKIRYFSSQCWPFPNSLMLGYFAEYLSGEAEADGEELETLGWFRADAMPEIPPHGSIARRMIDHWLELERKG